MALASALAKLAAHWPPVTVSLVGAGPGDPGLITAKGLARLLAAAGGSVALPEGQGCCGAAAFFWAPVNGTTTPNSEFPRSEMRETFANGTFPAGNPEGIKNLSTDGIGWVVELDLADLGPDGEQYRHGFRWLNNFSRNDNARFVQMCRTMSLPATTPAQALEFEQAIEPLIDVDEWMRCMAMMSLFGIDDAYGRPVQSVDPGLAVAGVAAGQHHERGDRRGADRSG